MKFLVVDEHPTMRNNLIKLLWHLGYTDVIQAPNANQVLWKFEMPMVVIVDGCIPGNDGLMLVAALRSREDSRDAPIIMILPGILSSRTESIREEALQAGVNGFVDRPLTPSVLKAAIDPLLLPPMPKVATGEDPFDQMQVVG